MKDYTLTLVDTYETIIAKVTIQMNKMLMLNIETILSKSLKACVKYKT